MSVVKNVVLAGAAGSLGSVIFKKLVASGKFNIRLLRRQGSTSTLPSDVEIVDVDFESVDSLKAALTGQDALISATGSFSIESQKTLVEAAVAAGIKRYIPSEFGSDLDIPQTRALPVYGHKVEIQDAIIAASKTSDFTYTLIYNSAFLDWGIQHGFIFNWADSKPLLINGGDAVFSATTISTVGDAVVGVLTHLEETKNRSVRVEDIKLTQKKLLELAKQAAPEKPWEAVVVDLDEKVAASNAQLAKGEINEGTFIPYLWQAVLAPGYGGEFTKNDNELLGVKGGKTDQDVIDILKPLLK